MPQLSPRYLAEQVLLSRLARYLWTADSQFGFKQAHGTKLPYLHSMKFKIFTVIRAHLYTCMCFLDAEKAFDRVNHWTLAKKLLDRNVSLHIMKIGYLLV